VEACKMTSVINANGQLIYEVFGSGNKVLLAFHGFGQDRLIFKKWADTIRGKYTIFSFDLFYHGQSDRAPVKLQKHEWKSWMDQFLRKENIEAFSVLGYSLGGRFAISTAMEFPNQINEMILVAPDGIFLTPWFRLATTPGLRWAFKFLMVHPNVLEGLIKFNDRSQLVSPYIADFARKEMGDLENRERVYRSWNHFKSLGYSHKELIHRLNQSTFQKKLIVGEKDQIIQPQGILPIVKRIEGLEIHRLPLKHHQLAKPEVADLLL